jgi:hypothetical protein
MKLDNIENISRVIHVLDVQILKLINEKELDDRRIAILSDIRFEYMKEMNALSRVSNTREMFDKEYHKMYKKSYH